MMENDTTNKEELTQLLNEANELYENIRGNISIQEKAIITDKKENILMTFSVNKKKDYNDIVERMYKYIQFLFFINRQKIKIVFQNIEKFSVPCHLLNKFSENLINIPESEYNEIKKNIKDIEIYFNKVSKGNYDIMKYIYELKPFSKYLTPQKKRNT